MPQVKEPKRFVVTTDNDTHRAAKVKAAQEGTTISDKVRELIARWISGGPSK